MNRATNSRDRRGEMVGRLETFFWGSGRCASFAVQGAPPLVPLPEMHRARGAVARFALAIALAIALLATGASAGGATGIKLKDVKEEAKPAKGRTGPADFKAPISSELDADEAIAKKRDEEIEKLKAILPDFPETATKADLYFQLAENVWEKSRYLSLQEMKEYDENYQKWAKAKEASAQAAGVSFAF